MSVEDGIPEGGQANEAPQHDWEKDYKELQATYTQGQQRLKELERYESDPQSFLELGKTKGWIEFDEPEPDPGVDPHVAQTQAELAEIRAWREQVEAERHAERAAAGEELFHQDLDTWASEQGETLSPADHNAIFGLLMKAPDPTQESAARQIFDAHVASKKAEREQWQAEYEEARKRPRVPHIPSGGGTDTGARSYDDMSRAEIAREMAEQVRARNQH